MGILVTGFVFTLFMLVAYDEIIFVETKVLATVLIILEILSTLVGVLLNCTGMTSYSFAAVWAMVSIFLLTMAICLVEFLLSNWLSSKK